MFVKRYMECRSLTQNRVIENVYPAKKYENLLETAPSYFQKEFGSVKICRTANMSKRSLLANLQVWRS